MVEVQRHATAIDRETNHPVSGMAVYRSPISLIAQNAFSPFSAVRSSLALSTIFDFVLLGSLLKISRSHLHPTGEHFWTSVIHACLVANKALRHQNVLKLARAQGNPKAVNLFIHPNTTIMANVISQITNNKLFSVPTDLLSTYVILQGAWSNSRQAWQAGRVSSLVKLPLNMLVAAGTTMLTLYALGMRSIVDPESYMPGVGGGIFAGMFGVREENTAVSLTYCQPGMSQNCQDLDSSKVLQEIAETCQRQMDEYKNKGIKIWETIEECKKALIGQESQKAVTYDELMEQNEEKLKELEKKKAEAVETAEEQFQRYLSDIKRETAEREQRIEREESERLYKARQEELFKPKQDKNCALINQDDYKDLSLLARTAHKDLKPNCESHAKIILGEPYDAEFTGKTDCRYHEKRFTELSRHIHPDKNPKEKDLAQRAYINAHAAKAFLCTVSSPTA